MIADTIKINMIYYDLSTQARPDNRGFALMHTGISGKFWRFSAKLDEWVEAYLDARK